MPDASRRQYFKQLFLLQVPWPICGGICITRFSFLIVFAGYKLWQKKFAKWRTNAIYLTVQGDRRAKKQLSTDRARMSHVLEISARIFWSLPFTFGGRFSTVHAKMWRGHDSPKDLLLNKSMHETHIAAVGTSISPVIYKIAYSVNIAESLTHEIIDNMVTSDSKNVVRWRMWLVGLTAKVLIVLRNATQNLTSGSSRPTLAGCWKPERDETNFCFTSRSFLFYRCLIDDYFPLLYWVNHHQNYPVVCETLVHISWTAIVFP